MTNPVLEGQASFAVRAHNPDVLTCIANLSNDEVFTPPELANQMLDTVAAAWADDNDGADIWQDPDVTFLDPFTKSGVFLREIVARLTEGLADKISELQERVDHILTKQVYGISITQLTALLARRSVYCSKDATGKHSVAKSFDRDWGNIWFERTEHTWAGEKCAYCGAQRIRFERDDQLETHAYAFTHTTDIKKRLAQMFGVDVQFDVIIGNPPYQLTGAAGGSSDASIYHHFVEQAQRMEPRYLSMVIPARWLAGGRGMTGFREAMFRERHIRFLADYPLATDIFPATSADFEGGACYFLWDAAYAGPTAVENHRGADTTTSVRELGEFDVFVRDGAAAKILRKVISQNEPSLTSILAKDTPFGLATNFKGFAPQASRGTIPLYLTRGGQRTVAHVDRTTITKNRSLIDSWKVLVPKAYGERGLVPAQVLGRPWIAPAGSVCTQSFLFIAIESEAEARSAMAYYSTRFFRFLVSLRKITQDALHSTYSWVPVQPWDRTWTDQLLYEKYKLTKDEIALIESHVKPMVLEEGSTDA